jgi:hypothetical protein
MKKQTAVQWLQQSLSLTFEQEMSFEGLFQQALEMEKEYQDDLAIEFTYYLSDWHTKKRVKQLLEIYKKSL